MGANAKLAVLDGPDSQPPRPSPETPVSGPSPATAIRKLALQQLRRFAKLASKVLRGDGPKTVHDLRVTTRRLEQALDLLEAPRREVRKAHRKLRRARRAVSELRNGDMLLVRVDAELARRNSTRHEAWQAVREYIAERRDSAFDDGTHKLARLNVGGMYVRLKESLAVHGHAEGSPPAPGPTSPDVPHHHPEAGAHDDLPEKVSAALDRSWQSFEARISDSQTDPRPATIHRARKAVKRLRYLVEVLAELGIPASAGTLAELRKVQRRLGNWHDAEVLEEALIEIVARPAFLRKKLELGMEIEKLILASRASRNRYKHSYLQTGSEAYRKIASFVASVQSSTASAFAG